MKRIQRRRITPLCRVKGRAFLYETTTSMSATAVLAAVATLSHSRKTADATMQCVIAFAVGAFVTFAAAEDEEATNTSSLAPLVDSSVLSVSLSSYTY